jgi:hypothetical protein
MFFKENCVRQMILAVLAPLAGDGLTRSGILWILPLCIFAAGGCETGVTASGPAASPVSAPTVREARNREWLVNYLTQPIPDTPRNRRYLAAMTYRPLDTEWFARTGQTAGADERRGSRGQTNHVGRNAFLYHTPGMASYHDPKALDDLRVAFRSVVAHVSPEGKFTWEEKLTEYGYEAHEHAWRLEPLLCASIWVGADLPPDERDALDKALRRAAEWLRDNPMTQTNNRGCVCCAVSALAGLYFDDPTHLARAAENAKKILPVVIADNGEVGEHYGQYGGGGPDSNYSYTSWAYIYLYRLCSGDSAWDGNLLKAMRWFANYNTLSGSPRATGASVRVREANPGLDDIVPALERFSHVDPFFATVADRALAKRERASGGGRGFGGHIISPYIWALFEKGVEGAPGPFPNWYADCTDMFSWPEVQYALIGRQYQTGIVFRGRPRTAGGGSYYSPLRGVQCFAWGDEMPILLHTNDANSSIRADGLDFAAEDVDSTPAGPEVALTEGATMPGKPPSKLATLAARRGHLWTLYVCTPGALVVVCGGAKGPVSATWAMNRSFLSEPKLDAEKRFISFADRQGRIYYQQGEARIVSAPQPDAVPATPSAAPSAASAAAAGGTTVRTGRSGRSRPRADTLECVVPAGQPAAFAFSDGAFSFKRFDAAAMTLEFEDGSGAYRLSLTNMLDATGNLDRQVAMRLTASR